MKRSKKGEAYKRERWKGHKRNKGELEKRKKRMKKEGGIKGTGERKYFAKEEESCRKHGDRCGKCSKIGAMKCGFGGGFLTCDNGSYVLRSCAPGTSCKPNGESIICGR